MTVLLTFDAAAAANILRLAEGRVPGRVLVKVELIEATPMAAVARARATHGGTPLGFLAANESDALEAVGAGADEALVGGAEEARTAVGFLERLALRAALRREQENRQATLAQTEKLAALGTVVAGVAHEINNPLAAVLLLVESMKMTLNPLLRAQDEVQRLVDMRRGATVDELANIRHIARTGVATVETRTMLDEMESSAQTIACVVRDLRIFARADDDEQPRVLDLPELIDQVIRIVGREITARGHIERDYPPDVPPLALPRTRMAQVFTNILVNAAHAIAEVQRPMHRVRISIRSDDEAVAVSISDTGPGIAAESIDRIFDPFFTTKRVGAGTGLGLSISRSILRRLGGDLIVESVHGVGATFVAMIPLPDHDTLKAAYRRSAISGSIYPSRRPKAAVLFVDDDERILRNYPRLLRERFDVFLAADGQEAIDLLGSGSNPDVIVTDMAMPAVDGKQLYAWLLEHRPELARKLIFVTATAGERDAEFLATITSPVLTKPVAKDALVAAIDDLLSASTSG